MKSNIETYLRLKPLLNENNNGKSIKNKMIKYEIEEDKNKSKIYISVPNEYNNKYVNNTKKSYEFKFTGIFGPNTSQEEIFKSIGTKIINSSLEGYNSTLFCYGQTGSGKTYTICGKNNSNMTSNRNGISSDKGIIPRLLVSFFNKIREKKK